MKMKSLIPIAAFSCMLAYAQNIEQPQVSEEIQKAIDEFNRKRSAGVKEPNEVVVVFGEEQAAPKAKPVEAAVADETKPDADTAPIETNSAEDNGLKNPAVDSKKTPVLVNGKQPKILRENPNADAIEVIPELKKGLSITIQPLKEGIGSLDVSKISLKAPFPPKQLANSPENWILVKSADAPPFKKEVELEPGKTITLEIPPHVLVPVANGKSDFSIAEPGFSSQSGYQQVKTVNAILSKSIAQLDEDSIQLTNALSDLHQILASLPAADQTSDEEPIEE